MTSHPPATERQPARFTFSLRGLMLLVTLISLHLGLIAAVPSWGVPVAILVLPACVQSSLLVARMRSAGCKVRPADICFIFLDRLVLTVVLVGWGILGLCVLGLVFLLLLQGAHFIGAANDGPAALVILMAMGTAFLIRRYFQRRRRAARLTAPSTNVMGDPS